MGLLLASDVFGNNMEVGSFVTGGQGVWWIEVDVFCASWDAWGNTLGEAANVLFCCLEPYDAVGSTLQSGLFQGSTLEEGSRMALMEGKAMVAN